MTMTCLSERTVDYLKSLSAADRKTVLADYYRQLSVVQLSWTETGDAKRRELEARIDVLEQIEKSVATPRGGE